MLRKIFNLVPEALREKIKLYYYNFINKEFIFSVENGFHRTRSVAGWSVLTKSPLYFIVRDVDRYEKYYSVGPGDVVIDAGANIGVLTLIYSKKVDNTGFVYAFEPDNQNIIGLKENLALNHGQENISVQESGLWFKKDEILFYEAGTVGSSIFPSKGVAVKKIIDVTTIDAFVEKQNLKKLDFVKMDIEGAEIQALVGAEDTIRKLQPNFAIASYHVVDGVQTYKRVEKIFRDLNFPFHTEFFSDGEIITYAGPSLVKKLDY